jgi:hypothetical protein
MNKFQATAQIMEVLTADDNLIRGSRQYKIARKLVSKMIEYLGPDEALASITSKKSDFLNNIGVLGSFDDYGRKIPDHKL